MPTRRWFLTGFAAALACASGVGHYYRIRYGIVRLRPLDRASPLLLLVVVALAVLVWRQLVFEWPVPVPVIFVGSVLVGLGSVGGGLRRHYVIIGCAWLLFPVLGSFGLSGEARLLLFDALIGVSIIGAGVGDHLILRRMLAPWGTHGRTV